MAQPETDDLLRLADARANAILAALSRRFLGPRDSEQRKTLAKIYAAIRSAQRMEIAASLHDPQRAIVRTLLGVDASTLSLDALLAQMDVWDRTLIETGDELYVTALLRTELVRDRQQQATSVVLWSGLYDDRDLWMGRLASGKPLAEHLAPATTRLLGLYRARTALYQLERAREQLSREMLSVASLIGLVLVVFLAVAIALQGTVLLAAAAGALGGSLSGTRQLRDSARRINVLRSFEPLAVLQPLVGAGAGLVVVLLISAGSGSILNAQLLASENAWAVYGLVAFVVGYSEPVFIRVIDRLAVSIAADEPAPGDVPPQQAEPPAGPSGAAAAGPSKPATREAETT
jgi:hypothetical protein